MRFIEQDTTIKDIVHRRYSPTEQEKKRVERAYEDLRGVLGEGLFRSGSLARYTAIRPIHDLDVIYPTNNAVRDNPEAVLRELKNTIDSKRLNGVNSISIQSHSISLSYNLFNIDIVPAIRICDDEDSSLLVPEVLHARSARLLEEGVRSGGEVRWVKSNPKFYIRQAKTINDSTKGNFRYAVRLMKAWKATCKNEYGDNFKLKSFHIEQELAHTYMKKEFIGILDALILSAQSIIQHINSPHIVDAADNSKFIDEYIIDLNEYQKQIVLKELHLLVGIINKYGSDDGVVDKLINRNDVAVQERIVKPLKPWSGLYVYKNVDKR